MVVKFAKLTNQLRNVFLKKGEAVGLVIFEMFIYKPRTLIEPMKMLNCFTPTGFFFKKTKIINY